MLNTKIHNVQIEQAVLAALMTVSESYTHVENLLAEDDFHATRHKLIFKAVADLDAKNSPYDAVLVNEWLASHGMIEQAGGEQYLIQVMQEAPSSFYNLVSYAEKLKDLTTCRKVEEEAHKVIQKAQNLTVSRGELVVNEIAPRPHNSGHHTIDACVTSQFEQQVRALCGLPLGEPRAHSASVMVNLLGDLWYDGDTYREPDWAKLYAIPNLKLHLYGKHHARPGRKMGHFTVIGDNAEQVQKTALAARAAIGIKD